MATFISKSKPQLRKLTLLLNISFISLLCFLLKAYHHPSKSNFHGQSNAPLTTIFNHARLLSDISVDGCNDLHKYSDCSSKCLYVKTHLDCRSKGYINYLQIFYCNIGQSPILGQTLLALWLVVLFYLLGDTASNYFCNSLQGLSNILRLSPTIAGVTLLSLGNGAPDFFASVVSFTGTSDGALGLNSILGGAFFVSSVVLGIISILVSPSQVVVDKASFIRDVLFFLFSLLILFIIISIGKISLLGSIFYVSIYFLYVCVVSATHFIYGEEKKEREFSVSSDELLESGIPLLGYVDDDKPNFAEEVVVVVEDKEEKPESFGNDSFDCFYLGKFLQVLELPLSLPRRLTIPVVNEEKWSKPYAVISVTLAPVMLAAVCNTQRENMGSRNCLVMYLTASLIGIVLGNMACVTTNSSSPPKKSLFPWLAGGFAMSVTWTYIIAEELVSLLVSIGNIIGVSPTILGLTVLAWGNSLGDLIANGAMAMNGGTDGAQMAISGCYAGPMFNTLMGLGVPLVLSAWSDYPYPYVIPKDHSLYETLLFLMGGLLWALVILPKKNMRMDKFLGVGLLSVYLCFLFIRIAMAIGVLKF
ncbi:cation/calcium exchanger 1-like [Gastrolobium bilobum]|uniref:cation/calcium exchanger 1-like n=1 Tax=Gastrolobium bilobum TaxID=150636 RepID=UPI002AB2F9A5|nr:cation/calcium exchanger 1-like [Gastrolobium bilobum]